MKLEPFLATFTGGKFYPFGPDPDRLDIRDIAHALSNQCRYAGHTSKFWSVAAHSLAVARRVEADLTTPARLMSPDFSDERVKRTTLTALLHDASEAFLLDVPAPIKPLFLNYDAWEENVARVIASKFGLVYPYPEVVERFDKVMVSVEIANFFPPHSEAWTRYGMDAMRAAELDYLKPLEPEEAERQFLARFHQLGGCSL